MKIAIGIVKLIDRIPQFGFGNLIFLIIYCENSFFYMFILWKFISYFYVVYWNLYFIYILFVFLWKICSKRVHNEYCYIFQHTNMMMEIQFCCFERNKSPSRRTFMLGIFWLMLKCYNENLSNHKKYTQPTYLHTM